MKESEESRSETVHCDAGRTATVPSKARQRSLHKSEGWACSGPGVSPEARIQMLELSSVKNILHFIMCNSTDIKNKTSSRFKKKLNQLTSPTEPPSASGIRPFNPFETARIIQHRHSWRCFGIQNRPFPLD